jgi:hypothetical protein
MSIYRARPGSIPYRVIAWLEQQPVGATFPLSALAEAVGGDGKTLLQIITPAIDGGAIRKHIMGPAGGRPYRYSLEPEQHPGLGYPQNVPQAPAGPKPTLPTIAPAATQPASDGAVRVALWSDGALQIERPGSAAVRFSRAEARQIVDYLQAISTDLTD